MSDDRTGTLPDGTDTVIAGASETGDTGGTSAAATDRPAIGGDGSAGTGGSGSGSSGSGGGGATSSQGSGLADRLRSGREQITSQAGDRARGLLGQGLERTSEALANVSRMVGDTAPGIEERLGPEYGDYARRAAGAIENVANNIAEKDPDELMDDARTFVRNSPGIALAGAAVVGFVMARLIKSGLAPASEGDSGND